MTTPISAVRLVALVSVSLCAFAGNSILCRIALGTAQIDAASFTVIRLVFGATTLMALWWWQHRAQPEQMHSVAIRSKTIRSRTMRSLVTGANIAPSLMLFLYAITFSYAYVTLDTGIGALILFATVQLTMVLIHVVQGHRPNATELIGLTVAFIGFLYLVWPTLTTPSLSGLVLMTVSGIAWGLFTLAGRDVNAPLTAAAGNFVLTLPAAMILLALTWQTADMTVYGLSLAIASGSLTSGIGYAFWYAALKHLTAMRAAVVQLSVPVIAAGGGVIFMGEIVTAALVISTLLVLSGIFVVLFARQTKRAPS